jgi:hypothetical protein
MNVRTWFNFVATIISIVWFRTVAFIKTVFTVLEAITEEIVPEAFVGVAQEFFFGTGAGIIFG